MRGYVLQLFFSLIYLQRNNKYLFTIMTTTPQKLIESSACLSPILTPVRFLDSPKTKSTSNDSNVAAVKSRLEVLIKSLQDNYTKWQLAEQRGLALCNAIESIKTRVLAEEGSNKTSIDDITLYPAELQPYCDKLAVISSIFADILSHAQQTLRQLGSLAKLPGCYSEIFYRSWQMSQFMQFVEILIGKYKTESKVKHTVMEELPHCQDREQLIRGTSAWEYPQYVDDSVALMFSFLAEEISIKIK